MLVVSKTTHYPEIVIIFAQHLHSLAITHLIDNFSYSVVKQIIIIIRQQQLCFRPSSHAEENHLSTNNVHLACAPEKQPPVGAVSQVNLWA